MLAVLRQEERHIEIVSFIQNSSFLGSLKSFHFSFFIWFFGPGAFVSGFFINKRQGFSTGILLPAEDYIPVFYYLKPAGNHYA